MRKKQSIQTFPIWLAITLDPGLLVPELPTVAFLALGRFLPSRSIATLRCCMQACATAAKARDTERIRKIAVVEGERGGGGVSIVSRWNNSTLLIHLNPTFFAFVTQLTKCNLCKHRFGRNRSHFNLSASVFFAELLRLTIHTQIGSTFQPADCYMYNWWNTFKNAGSSSVGCNLS